MWTFQSSTVQDRESGTSCSRDDYREYALGPNRYEGAEAVFFFYMSLGKKTNLELEMTYPILPVLVFFYRES